MAGNRFARVALTVVVALLTGVFAGCGKDESSAVSEAASQRHRMEDPAYVAALGEARQVSNGIAARRWQVVEKMQAIVEKAKAEGKEPPDYPEWKGLSEENERFIKELQEHNRKTQELVRERIRQSMKEQGGQKK